MPSLEGGAGPPADCSCDSKIISLKAASDEKPALLQAGSPSILENSC